MGKKKTAGVVTAQAEAVTDYRHPQAKRKNNPPAKMAAEGVVLMEYECAGPVEQSEERCGSRVQAEAAASWNCFQRITK